MNAMGPTPANVADITDINESQTSGVPAHSEFVHEQRAPPLEPESESRRAPVVYTGRSPALIGFFRPPRAEAPSNHVKEAQSASSPLRSSSRSPNLSQKNALRLSRQT